jgi:hypothetical protein
MGAEEERNWCGSTRGDDPVSSAMGIRSCIQGVSGCCVDYRSDIYSLCIG